MSENCEMPQPTEQHRLVLGGVGTWNVDCTYWMGPQEMKCRAKETVEAVGGFWTVSRFESDFMGMPFVGRCTLGWDGMANEFVGVWVDSMSPHMFAMRGTFDAAKHVLTMKARGPNMQTGEMTDFRMVTTFRDADHFAFDMFMALPGADDVHVFHYEYERA